MVITNFRDWMRIHEQQAVPNGTSAEKNGYNTNDVPQKIKKTLVGSLGKPDKVRKDSLKRLAVQMSNDPKATDDDIKAVSKAMEDDPRSKNN